MDNWPFDQQPVYHRAQPRRPSRVRHQSDAFVPRLAHNGQKLMVDDNGNLMMPVVDQFGRPQRASSVSGQRPAPIIIMNDIHNQLEDNERPLSAHGYYSYEGALMRRRPSNRSPGRSMSVARRRRTPEIWDDDSCEMDDSRRMIRCQGESPRPPYRRSKEDDEKIRELEEKEKELRELREKEKEKERKKKLEEELLLQELEKERKRKLREEEDKKLAEKAIKDFQEKERKEKAKKEKEREERDAAFIELLRTEGYSEAEARKKLKSMERRMEKGITSDDDGRGASNDVQLGLVKPKPVYMKIHRKYISPDTLDAFQLPWAWDDRDAGYIIIKKWVGERNQEILFNHTKRLAESARITYPRESLKEDATRLVIARDRPRRRSPIKRTSWFLT